MGKKIGQGSIGKNGNTDKHSSQKTKKKKKKQGTSLHNWCFTWNNYKMKEIVQLVPRFDDLCWKYVFQEEIGKNNTPHIQGSIWLSNKLRLTALKKFNSAIHWEPMRNELASQEYCMKSDTRKPDGQIWTKGIRKPIIDPLEGKELYDFQKEILEIIQGKPDDRKVYWFWDFQGCKGKTSLAKHICMHYNALYVQGKASDIKYGVIDMIKKKGEIDIVIMGLPRSYEQFVSYDAIESIKDGIFYSSKYESGMCIFNSPHVIILANFEPDEEKLSKDRWVIKCLDDFEIL